ncbi:hypothetical protein SAMN06265376_101744 [Dokdonia pacifica]|uniref:Uncharacterized protein n=1 Tax=Dokdonia pacifica TaxID=1627892 RepID=A0A238W6J1_9FLAO|nr:hypothetical protein SAMN06265376_101744 [Dokdonia pacifica]
MSKRALFFRQITEYPQNAARQWTKRGSLKEKTSSKRWRFLILKPFGREVYPE